jgi:hypothetical protein
LIEFTIDALTIYGFFSITLLLRALRHKRPEAHVDLGGPFKDVGENSKHNGAIAGIAAACEFSPAAT